MSAPTGQAVDEVWAERESMNACADLLPLLTPQAALDLALAAYLRAEGTEDSKEGAEAITPAEIAALEDDFTPLKGNNRRGHLALAAAYLVYALEHEIQTEGQPV